MDTDERIQPHGSEPLSFHPTILLWVVQIHSERGRSFHQCCQYDDSTYKTQPPTWHDDPLLIGISTGYWCRDREAKVLCPFIIADCRGGFGLQFHLLVLHVTWHDRMWYSFDWIYPSILLAHGMIECGTRSIGYTHQYYLQNRWNDKPSTDNNHPLIITIH